MSRFIEFLTYRAKKLGKKVIKIDERNTTKTCAKCGTRKKRQLSERVIKCNCGNSIDRDLNSAANILLRFLWYKFIEGHREIDDKYLLREPSMDEESFLKHYALGKDLLRQTAQRKTKVAQTITIIV